MSSVNWLLFGLGFAVIMLFFWLFVTIDFYVVLIAVVMSVLLAINYDGEEAK